MRLWLLAALLLCGCHSGTRIIELQNEIAAVRAEHKKLETNLPIIEQRRQRITQLQEELAVLRGLVEERKARR